MPLISDGPGLGELSQVIALSWGDVGVRAMGTASLQADATPAGEGVYRIRVVVEASTAGGVVEVNWRVPCTDAAVFWSPRLEGDPWLPMAVGDYRFTSSAARYAPLGVLLAHDGTARMAFAASETLWPVEIGAGVDDLSLAADFTVSLRVSLPAEAPPEYVFEVLLDTRRQPLAATVTALTDWYAAENSCLLSPRLEHAQAAVYSTWYCFQQTIDAKTVEEEAARARETGFGTLIIDDGWQTSDTSRTYAFCGDWEPDPDSFPDMAGHVARLHDLGLRCLLWIAPPLLGRRSGAWQALSGYTLGFNAEWQAAVLDPREPVVRAHLVRACTRAVEEWNVDGLKIDFIDALAQLPAPPPSPTADCSLVEEGVDRLLSEITAQVHRHRPDAMVEFRQEYVSPRLWRYGNLLRAFDCPYDAIENRVRTLRARLLAGPGTAHSDPIAWHPDSTGEDVARQLLNAAFAVPQVSMRLDTLDPEHRQVLTHWLAVVAQWRDVLLTGRMTADRPELNHPSVSAYLGDRAVLASYADTALPVQTREQPRPTQIAVLNGSVRDRVLLDAPSPLGAYTADVRDYRGRLVSSLRIDLSPGIHPLPVPAGGTAHLRST
ncbi:glycoside hydrolase family 36 protein [Streptomyces sp. SYSU K217416]